MPLSVAVGGAYKTVAKVWVAVDGTYRLVQGIDTPVVGSYKDGFTPGAKINTFTALRDATYPYTTTSVTWDTTNATKVEILQNGVVKHTTTTAAGTKKFGGLTPSSTYTYTLKVTGQLGNKTSSPISVTLTRTPAPTNLRKTAASSSGYTAAWNSVGQADSYRFKQVSPGGNSWTTTKTSYSKGAKADTNYTVAVQATANGVSSLYSPNVSFKTPPEPYEPGVYTVSVKGGTTWQPGWNSWRPAGDGMWHGNGSQWGSTRGNMGGFFYYSWSGGGVWKQLRNALDAGATVTKVQVYLRRQNTSHGYSGTHGNVRWWLHGYTSQPGGSPSVIGGSYDAGQFSRGEGKWVTLPDSWGTKLIKGTNGVRGVAIGRRSANYYQFNKYGVGDCGNIKFTIK